MASSEMVVCVVNQFGSSELREVCPATGIAYVDGHRVNSKLVWQPEQRAFVSKTGIRYVPKDANWPGPADPAIAAATPYPDGNPKSIQGAKKFSLRLLPLPAAIVVNQALENGMHKYGAANWRKTGVAASVYVDAALRHLAQWFDGSQENAIDSGVHNLGHAMACLAILVDAQANGTLQDDRPMACKDTDQLVTRS